jgi:hypothetical protein
MMIMKRYSLFLLLPLLLITGSGLRAQYVIGFGPTGFTGMPDSVYSPTTQFVGTFLKNTSSLNFNDSIQVIGYIDTGSVNTVPLYFPPGTFSLNAGDSVFLPIQIDFRDTYMGGLFRIGNNTIVIWPVMYDPNWDTGDSLVATVFVMDSINGIHEAPSNSSLRCYPIPSSGPLYMVNASPHNQPVHAVIRNEQGQIVAENDNPLGGIDTEPWPAGIYLIEVTFEDGTKGTYKVMRK